MAYLSIGIIVWRICQSGLFNGVFVNRVHRMPSADYSTLFNVVQCCSTAYNGIQCQSMLYNGNRRYSAPYNAIQRYSMLSNVNRRHSMSIKAIQQRYSDCWLFNAILGRFNVIGYSEALFNAIQCCYSDCWLFNGILGRFLRISEALFNGILGRFLKIFKNFRRFLKEFRRKIIKSCH